ncbi:MAG: hypothetical protein JSU07_06275, partial [Bacteroidetes bacterium]|nr:hypothetical protein [Bacteroidota bacterium]
MELFKDIKYNARRSELVSESVAQIPNHFGMTFTRLESAQAKGVSLRVRGSELIFLLQIHRGRLRFFNALYLLNLGALKITL